MKKLLAALLALAMLLGACACAEGGQLTLRNVRLYQGDALLFDLTGLELALNVAGYEEDEGAPEDGGLQLSCTANGRALATAVLAAVGETLLVGYGNGGEATELYSLSTEGADSEGMDSEGAPAAGVDSDASFFEEICDAVPAEWKSDGGAVEYEGERCQCTTFEAPQEHIAQAVRIVADALAANPQFDLIIGRMGGADIFRSAAEEIAGSARFSGALYDGEGADYIEVSLEFTLEGESVRLSAVARYEAIERGDLLSVMLRLGDGDVEFGVSFDFEGVETDGAEWLQRLDIDGATNLDAVLAGEESFEPLLNKLESDMQLILGSLIAGVSNVIFTNQLNAARGSGA